MTCWLQIAKRQGLQPRAEERRRVSSSGKLGGVWVGSGKATFCTCVREIEHERNCGDHAYREIEQSCESGEPGESLASSARMLQGHCGAEGKHDLCRFEPVSVNAALRWCLRCEDQRGKEEPYADDEEDSSGSLERCGVRV